MHVLVNFLAFQVGWFACVLGAANAAPMLGPAVVVGVIALHMSRSNKPAREFTLILSAGLLGAVWDSSLVATGWVAYPSGNLFASLAPYWIVAMWMLFATTLNVSLRWLRGRTALAVALGGVAGPLAFYGGAQLGGVNLLDQRASLIALGFGWAVMAPLLILLSTRLDGMAAPIDSGQAHV